MTTPTLTPADLRGMAQRLRDDAYRCRCQADRHERIAGTPSDPFYDGRMGLAHHLRAGAEVAEDTARHLEFLAAEDEQAAS